MLSKNIVYKGFISNYQFAEYKASYIAKVINSNDAILCSGKSPVDLKNAFINCVDLYLDLCNKKGIHPNLTQRIIEYDKR